MKIGACSLPGAERVSPSPATRQIVDHRRFARSDPTREPSSAALREGMGRLALGIGGAFAAQRRNAGCAVKVDELCVKPRIEQILPALAES
jgi:hypothetical protein